MSQRLRTAVNLLGVLRIALSLFTIVLLFGSGWELLALILAIPGILSGILLIVGGRRSVRRPGTATICFVLATLLGAMANDMGIAFGGTGGKLVSLLMSGAFVIAPLILAVVTFRRYRKTRLTE